MESLQQWDDPNLISAPSPNSVFVRFWVVFSGKFTADPSVCLCSGLTYLLKLISFVHMQTTSWPH